MYADANANAMDVNDGPLWSSTDSLEASLETQHLPPVSDSSNSGSPTAKPARSADIPPDPASRPPEIGCRHYDGLSLELAREKGIHRWESPWRPEYGTLARRTRTFYQEAARWDPKEKPSVESIAEAGFFDGGFIIIII